MVRPRSKTMRCGPYFTQYAQELKKHSGVSDAKLTDSLARFLEDQRLTPVLLRKAQEYNKRPPRGVFG